MLGLQEARTELASLDERRAELVALIELAELAFSGAGGNASDRPAAVRREVRADRLPEDRAVRRGQGRLIPCKL